MAIRRKKLGEILLDMDVVLPEQIRASPTFDGRRTCLRTLIHLTCYGG